MARFFAQSPWFLAVFVAATLLFGGDARSESLDLAPQRAALTQVGQALSGVAVKAKRVGEALGYGFREGNCVFGVQLRVGQSADETFSLQQGQSYVFIGGGDKTARNLDLILRDASGHVVSQDIEADAAPFLRFQPKASGRYKLSLMLKSGWRGSAFCALTVLRKGALQLPLQRLVEAAIQLDFATFDAFSAARGGAFKPSPGWALYGAVLRQNQTLQVPPQHNSAVERGLVAAGDKGALVLDSALLDASGKLIANRDSSRSTRAIFQKLSAGVSAARVTNRRSSGPSLVLTVLLDLPENRPATTQLAAAPPIPSAPQISPFEGDWKGEDPQGVWKMRVQKGGDASGHLAVPDLKLSAKFEGAVNPDGTIYLRFTQSKHLYFADGTWKWSDESHQKVTGQLVFTTGGAEVGRAEFSLEKRQ